MTDGDPCDNQSVHLRWNDDLEAFEADATAPGSGADPTAGPAGPAGVCALRADGGALSQDLITGRVTSLWFEDDPDESTRELIGLVVDDADRERLDTSRGSAGFDLRLRPVNERADTALLAILCDAERHVPMDPASPAAFLLHAQLAAVLTALEQRGHRPLHANERQRHLELADRFAESFGEAPLRSRLPDGVRFDPVPVAAALDLIASALDGGRDPDQAGHASVELLRNTIFDLGGHVIDAGGPMGQRMGGTATAIEPVTYPALFARPDLTLVTNPDPIEAAPIRIRARVDADGRFDLGDLAARQAGMEATGGRCVTDGSWCTVTQPLIESVGMLMDLRVVALHNGTPVGTAPCGTINGTMTATFAVSDVPDELQVTAAAVRVDVDAHLASLEATDRLCRAAHWAYRLEDGRATTWFAHGAVGWYELGQMFRAGWAWRFADHTTARDLLVERFGEDDAAVAVAGLDAVAESGDVPIDRVHTVPVPAWVYAIDLERYAQGRDTTGGQADAGR